MADSERGELVGPANEEWIGANHESACSQLNCRERPAGGWMLRSPRRRDREYEPGDGASLQQKVSQFRLARAAMEQFEAGWEKLRPSVLGLKIVK